MSKSPAKKTQNLYGLDPEIKNRKPIAVSVTCKHCAFYKNRAAYIKPCNELGIAQDEDPCPRFTPDLVKSRGSISTTLPVLHALGKLEDFSFETLLALVATSYRLKSSGFRLGSKVNVKTDSANVSGTVVGGWRNSVTLITDTGTMLTVPSNTVKATSTRIK